MKKTFKNLLSLTLCLMLISSLFIGMTSAAGNVIIKEDFESGNMNNWDKREPGAKVITVNNNKVMEVYDPLGRIVIGKALSGDYTIETDVMIKSGYESDSDNGNSVAILFGFKDRGNYYACYYNPDARKFKILRQEMAKFSGLGESYEKFSLDTWHKFKVVVEDNKKFTFYVDGVKKAQGTDSKPLAPGRAGVMACGKTRAYFDNFTVTVDNAATSTPVVTPTHTPKPTPAPTPAPAIKVKFNSEYMNFSDVKPANISGRVMVPFRAIFEKLGATVTWDQASQTAKGVKSNITIELKVGSKEAKVNGAVKTLDVPATNINGRILVPVRFVSENFGADVTWDQASHTVVIVTK